jgi:hypothetical protein
MTRNLILLLSVACLVAVAVHRKTLFFLMG